MDQKTLAAAALIAVAIFGMVMELGSWASSKPSEVAAKPAKAAPVPGEWSEMPALPGTRMAFVSVESEESVSGKKQVSYGVLSVRCVEGYVGVIFEPDPSRLPDQVLHYWLDDGPRTAIHESLHEKTSTAILGFAPLAKKLLSATTFSVDFASDGGIRRTATFKLLGFRDVEERIREACPNAGLPKLRP